MIRRRSWFLAAAGLFLLECFWFRRFRIDDAFITYRYARHWAAGSGPVMNLGERVEGVSNLPWTALLACGARLGLEPHLLAPVLGVVCGLLCIGCTLVLARQVAAPGASAGVAGLLLAACAPVAIWSVSGLETVAYAAAVTAFLALALRPSRQQSGLVLGAVLALVAAMRPEGFLLALAWCVTTLGSRDALRRGLRVAVAFFAIIVPLLLLRHAYYGAWVANTVLAKASLSPAVLAPGAAYLGKALLFVLPLLALAVVGLRGASASVRALFLWWVGLQTLFVLGVGGERFPGYRFVVPLLPVLTVLAARAPAVVDRQLLAARLRQSWGRLALAAVVLCSVLVLWRPQVLHTPLEAAVSALRLQQDVAVHRDRLLQEARFAALAVLALVGSGAALSWRPGAAPTLVLAWCVVSLFSDVSLRSCRQPGAAARNGRIVGTWLGTVAPPDVLVATNAAGALPYFSRLPVIDMLGLTDAHIARGRADRHQWIGHEKGDGQYVLARHPDVVIFGGPEGSARPWGFVGDQEIAASDSFVSRYELQRVRLPEFTFTYWRARAGRMPRMPPAPERAADS